MDTTPAVGGVTEDLAGKFKCYSIIILPPHSQLPIHVIFLYSKQGFFHVVEVCLEIVRDQNASARSGWTGFGETPFPKEKAEAAVAALPQKFFYKQVISHNSVSQSVRVNHLKCVLVSK